MGEQMSRINLLRSLLGLLALCVAIDAKAQTPAEWNQVIEAAKKEGRLVLYSGQTGFPEHPAIAKLFEAKYGIKVDILEGRAPELMERIRAEATITKRPIGDIVQMGSTGQVPMSKNGLIQRHGGFPNLSKLALTPWTEEEVPGFMIAYGIAVNPRLVPPADEPKSWADMTNPKWKGKILSDQMFTAGMGQTWFAVMLDAFGQGFHDKMGQQAITFDNQIKENPRRVARGEFAMSIPFNLADINNLQGLPVKAVIPQEGMPYTPVAMSMVKDAPHPNAARLFLNFVLEPEAQLIFARGGYPIAVKGLDDQLPPQSRAILTAKRMGHAKVELQDERVRLASKIYLGK